MAKKSKTKSAKSEIEENESGPLDSKPSTILISSDDEEANEDLSLKIIEKSLLVKAAARFDEGNNGVVSVVDLTYSSSPRGRSDVAGTSGGGGGEEAEDAVSDLKSKKTVKKKRKKTKIEKVVVTEDEDKAEMIEKVETVEEAIMAKAVESVDPNTVDKSVNNGVVSVVNLTYSSSQRGRSNEAGTSGGGGGSEEAVLDLKSKKTVKKKKKKTKIEKVLVTEDEDKAELIEKVETVEEAVMAKATDAVESVDPNTVDKSVNSVLRKLLRGARYFDPPDSGWETCYNCGEEGHMAVNCKSATKRKKPCFLCGSLEHAARQCSKVQDCFICKKGGHRAKDCPDKHNSALKHSRICLRCGGTGHDMFSCRNGYSHDDIKEIQCYMCKNFGHLCCVNVVDTNMSEVSCYRCGQLGHTGFSCGRSYGEIKETTDNGSPSLCYKCGEGGHFARECTTGTPSPSLCYKCGEGGHFARECTTGTPSSSLCYKCGDGGHFARECSSATDGKRNREPSTPNVRPRRENRDFSGYKATPHDHGKIHKRKKTKFEENGYSTPRKEKQRGGWITEDPGDYSNRNSTRSHWNSPSTPYTEGRKKSYPTSGGRTSGSQSSKKKNSHRYSASRFSNFGNDEPRRVYNGW